MNYEQIMQVGLTLNNNLGSIIIGANPKISLNTMNRLDVADKEIMVKTFSEELKFKVKKVDISTSISGSISIGMIIYDSDDFIKVKAGDEVYKIV
ncbi:hypothetical protein [Cohnella sp. GCM10027633]|uniref:hypothetical protein n=1 Tax=unclassified Cohnella TaxID=2636738 RepID=UPI00363A997A